MKALSVAAVNASTLLVDYVNAATAVARSAAAVNAQTLPTLTTPPANYGEFATTLGTAKVHARSWLDGMVPMLTQVPSSIIDYNAVVQAALTSIADGLQALESNPSNQQARSTIETSIQQLVTELTPCLTAVGNLDTWVSQYQGELSPDSTALTALGQQITAAEAVDAAEIAKLTGVIATLNRIIDERNELVTLDMLENFDIAFVLAVAGVAVGAPFSGAAAIIVGLAVGIGSAAFTTFVPVVAPPDYEQTMADLQDTMSAVNTEIGSVNTIVGLLQVTATQLAALVSQASRASSSAGEVLTFWKRQQTGLSTLVSDLDQTLDDLTSSDNLAPAIAEVSAAQAQWTALESSMSGLAKLTMTTDDTVQVPPWSPPS